MEVKNITYQVDERIATVTINRPKALNALNSETLTELDRIFAEIANDDSVAGVIVIGSGDKAFVAGADIAELSTKNPLTGRDFAQFGQGVFSRIEQLHKPVLAAVNGFALGGGCELAMACHLRIAAPNARFGQPEVGLGLIPGFGGTQRLPRLVGKGNALELLLGGGMISAREAHRIGLVNRIVETYKMDESGEPFTDDKGRKIFDREAFLNEAAEFLNGMIKNAPLALGHVIEAVDRGYDADIEAGLKLESDLFGILYSTEDTKEGLSAFLEKRPANFTGK